MAANTTTVKLQEEFERRVAEWRRTRADTSRLKKDIQHAMQEDTFHSAVLLRLNTEILIHELDLIEAHASFYAYIETQQMALVAAKAGAKAHPDTEDQCLNLMDSLFELAMRAGGEYMSNTVKKLAARLDSLEEISSGEFEARYAELRARISVAQVLLSHSDECFYGAVTRAVTAFGKLDSQNTESSESDADLSLETHYLRALLLALTRSVSEAFEPAKLAIRGATRNPRYALLFSQLLSADGQESAALDFIRAYFDDMAKYHRFSELLLVERVATLELKKTQILLTEEINSAPLQELTSFVDLIAQLFETPPHAPKHAQTKLTTARSHTAHFSFRKKSSLSVVVNGGSQKNGEANGRTNGNAKEAESTRTTSQNDQNAHIVGDSWIWISEKYVQYGLLADARGAMEIAERSYPKSSALESYSKKHSILGYLEDDPASALVEFRAAFQAAPGDILAGIGSARALASIEGELNDSDSEFANSLSSALEAACWRLPGRFLPELWHARGILLQKIGDFEEASAVFRRTVELEEGRAITPYVAIM